MLVLKSQKKFFFNAQNVFKIWGELVGNVVEYENRVKNYLYSFFVYKFSANCNWTCNYLRNKTQCYITQSIKLEQIGIIMQPTNSPILKLFNCEDSQTQQPEQSYICFSLYKANSIIHYHKFNDIQGTQQLKEHHPILKTFLDLNMLD